MKNLSRAPLRSYYTSPSLGFHEHGACEVLQDNQGG